MWETIRSLYHGQFVTQHWKSVTSVPLVLSFFLQANNPNKATLTLFELFNNNFVRCHARPRHEHELSTSAETQAETTKKQLQVQELCAFVYETVMCV